MAYLLSAQVEELAVNHFWIQIFTTTVLFSGTKQIALGRTAGFSPLHCIQESAECSNFIWAIHVSRTPDNKGKLYAIYT